MLVVTGGRGWSHPVALRAALGLLPRPLLLLHGSAPGCDTLAAGWAFGCGVPATGVPADWPRHGRAAGPIRNARLLTLAATYRVPVLLVAFPGGAGTRNMVNRARTVGVPVWQPLAGL